MNKTIYILRWMGKQNYMVNNKDSDVEVELINQHSQVISEISLCVSFFPYSDTDPHHKNNS